MVDEWPVLLKQASVQALTSPRLGYKAERLSAEQKDAEWLGSGPPVDPAQIQQLEERLGRKIPASLQEFFETSNGFAFVDQLIDRIRGIEELSWENRDPELDWLADAMREQGQVTDIEDGTVVDFDKNADRIRRALQMTDVRGNNSVVLLDPSAGSGEWPALIVSAEGMMQEFDSFYHAIQYQVELSHGID